MTDHELIANIHRRMDQQDHMLLEIRDTLTAHVAVEEKLRPHLEDLVTLWRGSRIMVSIVGGAAVIAGSIWGVIAWAKDHLK